MNKKTPKQEAEEWVQGRYGHIAIKFFGDKDFAPHPCLEAFLAGRKHFIEHELRKYLYMASEGEPRPADLGVKFKYTDDEIIKKAKED